MVRRRSFQEFDSSAASMAERLAKKQRKESDASTVDSVGSGEESPCGAGAASDVSTSTTESSGAAAGAAGARLFDALFEVPSDVLKGAVFVGHINTDLDSVAGAISGAYLYDGIPALSEAKEINGEIAYALKECGFEVPQVLTEIENIDQKNICLVDHTEQKQMAPYIRQNLGKIVGVIDHHALASSFSTEKPIFMDIRPWGCMCTILLHQYLRQQKVLPVNIAKLMMSAILSDTLNLKSPTTTKTDVFAVCLLSKYCGVEIPLVAPTTMSGDEAEDANRASTAQEDGVTLYANEMFAAKTEWVCGLGAEAMCRADWKEFEFSGKKLGIAVLEIAGSAKPVTQLEDQIRKELSKLCSEKTLDYQFLFVVDVLTQSSVLIPRGNVEEEIARIAFKLGEAGKATGCDEHQHSNSAVLSVGNYASRKKEFFPMIQTGIKAYLKHQ